MWEEWRCVGEVEVCDRGGEVWWEGWGECERGGDVWERWRCVTEVEKCGGRGGGVWEGWR